ncbi:MAG TPA: DUF898 family protein, partial [Magnetospirillum sp.]|nr:DUF898 family protein [Magnetospirillum sp.]
QMTRTLWRGIRGGQTGSASEYALLFLGVGIVSALTLGWASPWAEMSLARYRMGHTTIGDCRFTCDAAAGPLYKRFAVLWLCGMVFFAGIGGYAAWVAGQSPGEEEVAMYVLIGYGLAIPWALLTTALPLAWYRAGFLRHLVANTRLDGIPFAIHATTGSLIRLAIGNWLIMAFSGGILRPLTALRTFRYACTHLRMGGEPNWDSINQSRAALPGTGEGLAAVFDGGGEF